MLKSSIPRWKGRALELTPHRGALLLALACLQLTALDNVKAASVGPQLVLEPEIKVTRSRIVNRGLHSVQQSDTRKSDAKTVSPSLQISSEPDVWKVHFQRRRLQQDGGGSIVAISPSGAPLLRRASRSVPTSDAAGVALYKLQNNGLQDSNLSFLEVEGAPAPSASAGACFTLVYNEGYASLAVEPYETIRFTSDKGQCCELCEDDPQCVAWTRIAGGKASTRTCYLMNNLDNINKTGAAVLSPLGSAATVETKSFESTTQSNKASMSSTPQPAQLPGPVNAPALGFGLQNADSPGVESSIAAVPSLGVSRDLVNVPVSYLPESSPVIIESGTKLGNELPARYYGCPYPLDASGTCTSPAFCNCYDGVCYSSCQGNDLLEDFDSLTG